MKKSSEHDAAKSSHFLIISWHFLKSVVDNSRNPTSKMPFLPDFLCGKPEKPLFLAGFVHNCSPEIYRVLFRYDHQ
jgi:hypothetical protein